MALDVGKFKAVRLVDLSPLAIICCSMISSRYDRTKLKTRPEKKLKPSTIEQRHQRRRHQLVLKRKQMAGHQRVDSTLYRTQQIGTAGTTGTDIRQLNDQLASLERLMGTSTGSYESQHGDPLAAQLDASSSTTQGQSVLSAAQLDKSFSQDQHSVTATKESDTPVPSLYKPSLVDAVVNSPFFTSEQLPCHSASSPRPPLKRRRSPSPEHKAKTAIPPERKKLKMMASGNRPRPSATKRRLHQLLHRQKKVMQVPPGFEGDTPEIMLQEQETAAAVALVQQAHQKPPVTTHLNLLSFETGIPETIPQTYSLGQHENSKTDAVSLHSSSVDSWSKLDTRLAHNPRNAPRSHDKRALAKARLISKQRWHPYPTSDKRNLVVVSDLNESQGPLKDGVKPKGRALVHVQLPPGLPAISSAATIHVDELPSGQPTSRRSEVIESMKSVTLAPPENYTVSEASKECEPGDTRVQDLVASSQDNSGIIKPSHGPPEICAASSEEPNALPDEIIKTSQQLDDTNSRVLLASSSSEQNHFAGDGVLDRNLLPSNRADTWRSGGPRDGHPLDSPNPPAQPSQIDTQSQTEPGDGGVRQAETSPHGTTISEKAAGKRCAEFQRDGGLDSRQAEERPSYESEDAIDREMCVDEDEGETSGPHLGASLNPEEVYDHLVRYPDLPCTNAPMALLCDLVVELKSTINFMRCSTEPEPSVKESAVPAEFRRRSNRKGYRSKIQTPIKDQSRDKKHQPSFLVDVKADVRRLMHEFLEYPEKDLTAPAPTQLKQYKEKNPSVQGPSLNPLVLDLASKGSSDWNKKAAKLFREEFLSLHISDCEEEGLIEATFLTHVDYLRKVYLKQSLDVAGKVDAAQRAKEKAKYARRKELRERRFKTALLPYQNIAEMKAIRSTVSKFPMEVVSEDEREVVQGKEHYLVVKPDWRSSDGENLCEILDALHMASHFTMDDRPRPGRFSHPRTASHRLYMGPAPLGLPSNLYKLEYLESLTTDEVDDLNVQPKVVLSFPARIMRIAARFRHIQCHGTSPLPRNDPSLNVYVVGETYSAFID